jgi:hypothetical protein
MNQKPPHERIRPQVGDVVEIKTPNGLGYAQYVLDHSGPPPALGALVRVLPGLYDRRPDSFADLVRAEERFRTFFPLGAACAQRIVKIVAAEDVPEHARGVGLMRAPGARLPDGSADGWWLWDGAREWRVGELSKEQWKLPIRQIWNDTLLTERVASGWSPAGEVW